MKLQQDSFISGNAKLVRNINRAVILNLIREKQPISRIEIAKLSGLNKSTVSSIVAGLLAEALVYEEIAPNQNVGRNPIKLHLKLGTHWVGAINIDAPLTRLAIADLDGSVKVAVSFDQQSQNPEQFIRACVAKLFELRDQLQIGRLEGVGVSIAGIVDPVQAKVVFAPRLGWEDFEIGKLLAQLCSHEGIVVIDNDARASALAELWYGNHDLKLSDFVFLAVGPGIGTGIVVNKELIHGSSYAAGEFGHMTLFEGGELCSCGNYGCWEAYASDRATVKRYMMQKQLDSTAPPVMLQDIIDSAVQHHETLARDILRQTGHYLGMGIADIIKAVDPEAIIIGGRIIEAWDIVYPEIMQTLAMRAFFGKNRKIRILPTSLVEVRPRLLGAATLVVKEIFSDFKITR